MQIYSPYNVDIEKISSDKNALDLFAQKIESLGPDPRKLLFSADTPYILQAICLTYNFSENQSAELSRIIRDTLFGKIKATNFAAEISNRLEIDVSMGEIIKNEIKNKLFTPILKKEGDTTRPAMPPPPPPPQMKNGPPVNQSNVIDLRNIEH